MLQSRPVTASGGDKSAELAEHEGEALVRGLGAAPGVGHGEVRVISELADGDDLKEGDVLVTHMTAPDWVPLMRRSAAIVTDSGGMTCHAAIVSRELGIPCVVGTGDATTKLRDGELVTVDATHGVVYEGAGRHGRARRRLSGRCRHRRCGPASPRPSCWSTSPSPRRSSAPRRSTSTASACCAPS